MNFHYYKLDKRHTGHSDFKYAIGSGSGKIFKQNSFCEIREWCWTTYGPSKEINEWVEDLKYSPLSQWQLISYGPITHHNEFWAWQNNFYNRRIFLRTDKELALFKLRFC